MIVYNCPRFAIIGHSALTIVYNWPIFATNCLLFSHSVQLSVWYGMGLSTCCRSQVGVPSGTGTGHGDETHTYEYLSVTLLFWLSGSSSHLWSSFLDCMLPLFISCTTQTNPDILVGEFCLIWFHRVAFPTHCQQFLVGTQHIRDECEVAQRCTMMLKVWPNGWTCLLQGREGRKRSVLHDPSDESCFDLSWKCIEKLILTRSFSPVVISTSSEFHSIATITIWGSPETKRSWWTPPPHVTFDKFRKTEMSQQGTDSVAGLMDHDFERGNVLEAWNEDGNRSDELIEAGQNV